MVYVTHDPLGELQLCRNDWKPGEQDKQNGLLGRVKYTQARALNFVCVCRLDTNENKYINCLFARGSMLIYRVSGWR